MVFTIAIYYLCGYVPSNNSTVHLLYIMGTSLGKHHMTLCIMLYRAHTVTFTPTVGMFPSNLTQQGITLWEHSKPVNLENSTAVIHVSITSLNIKHMFAVEFPAVGHCIMAESGFWKIGEYRTLKPETDHFPPSIPGYCQSASAALLNIVITVIIKHGLAYWTWQKIRFIFLKYIQ